MADLSGYTPIYVRTTGDDSTGDGSTNSPFLTAQKAFEVAYAGTGDKVLDFGAGNFGGVDLNVANASEWPSRIAVRGAGGTQSFLGGITGNGANVVYDYDTFEVISPGENGRDISVVSNKTINLGNVSSEGGSGPDNIGGAGTITLDGCIALNLFSFGGFEELYFYTSGSGGTITLADSVVGNVYCAGVVGGNAGNGGVVTLEESTAGQILCQGAAGDYLSGDGGFVSLTDSTATSILASGGMGGYGENGDGGSVVINASNGGNINVAGGVDDNQAYDPGEAGTVVFNINSINSDSVVGNATFNDTASNSGTITGDATFNDDSFNAGTVSGAATYNGFTGTNSYGTFVNGQQVRTLYYNAAVDTDWAELGNWWDDDAFTIPATSLPTSVDSVVLTTTCDTNSGSEPTVVNLTFNDPDNFFFYLQIAVTVTGMATFNGSAENGGNLTGNATFNDTSYNAAYVYGDATFNGTSHNDGTASGNATFNDSSYNNFGIVTGDATFNGGSYNYSVVSGDATFNGTSYNSYGTVSGNAVFNNTAYNNGGVSGDATFNDSAFNEQGGSNIIGMATFNNTSYNNGGTSDATFNDTSYNASTGSANNATFNGGVSFEGGSYNEGQVAMNATFNDFSYNKNAGVVVGDATFNGGSYHNGTVSGNATFNDSAISSGGTTIGGSLTCNGSSVNASAVTGDATFNDNSSNDFNGSVAGIATFNGNSFNGSAAGVLADATFNDNSYNSGTLNTQMTITGKPIQVVGVITGASFAFTRAQLGINGSSILGLV